MKPKPHVFVPLSAEEALSRLEGRTATVAEILLSAAPDFYSPQDVPAGEWAQQRLVHVSRHEGELKLRLPRGETGQGRLGIEEQVWLLAGAARTLRRLGLGGDLPCRVELPSPAETAAAYHVVNLRGQAVNLQEAVSLNELCGLRAVREWVPSPVEGFQPVHEEVRPRLVSAEEALEILSGKRPGVSLALSTRGQYAAVAESSQVSPFGPETHLGSVSYAGGLQHDDWTLFLDVPAPEEADTLAWRLQGLAQTLIGLGVSASARCIVSVERGTLLLNPIGRLRDQNGQPFLPHQMYRLSHIRNFRDVEDLPTLKRPAEERIFDTEPVLSGEYTPEQALREAARCVECGLCRDICPNGVGLVSYVAQLKQGDLAAAARMLRESNPGVDLTCEVCPAPCQSLCILAHEDLPRRPVNIRGIERVLARHPVAVEIGAPAATGFKVALVGSGPANIVAAVRLAGQGHEVHIFEQYSELGGAVALIPCFRLRRGKARQWVEQLLGQTGVKIHTGIALGRDLKYDELRTQFDAVVLGIGAAKPVRLGIEGETLDGVVDALQVLRKFNKEAAGERIDSPPPRLRNTIVIGGGDVAADVVMWYVRTAARCAREAAQAAAGRGIPSPQVVNVVWAYRRGRADMPVSQEVLADAEDEINALKDYQLSLGISPAPGELPSGVYFHLRPLKVIGQAGKVCGIRFIRTRPSPSRDASGRRNVEDIPGSEFTIPADSVVVLAIGQRPDPEVLNALPGLVLDQHGRVRVDESMKAAEGIYAVGDLVGGEILADAISHGRRVAESIHCEYLARQARSN